MPILEVHNIEKHFGDTRVLEDISFDLEQGQALAIIGSSGSGKTTLLRCLNFLETPNQGRIAVNGEVIFDAEDPATQKESEVRKKRLHFGLVFQSFNLFPQYTALKNVTLAKELLAQEQPDFKSRKKEILAEIEAEGRDLLAKMGLADRINHYPSQLSGGQQQRVAIARALALHPDILCFDEPTSALDPGHPLPGGAEDHHDHCHPRDGLCPRCGRPGDLHGRRGHRGAGRRPAGDREPPAGAHPSVPVPVFRKLTPRQNADRFLRSAFLNFSGLFSRILYNGNYQDAGGDRHAQTLVPRQGGLYGPPYAPL